MSRIFFEFNFNKLKLKQNYTSKKCISPVKFCLYKKVREAIYYST